MDEVVRIFDLVNSRGTRLGKSDLALSRMCAMWPEARQEMLAAQEFHRETIVDEKWLCVVARYNEEDAFVVTAYLTDKPKQGEDLWPSK
jgi:hypothetical protein